MDINALKEAMKQRRGQGVDLKIIIGGEDVLGGEMPGEDAEASKDLAPDITDTVPPTGEEEDEEIVAEGAPPSQDMALLKQMMEHGSNPLDKRAMAMRSKK